MELCLILGDGGLAQAALVASGIASTPSKNNLITMGGEDEAACYAEQWGEAWDAMPGALAWLLALADTVAPPKHVRAKEP